MTAITSAQSGHWSETTTWTGGIVPVSGDSVTVAANHIVIFDVNQTAFDTGIAGLVLNGTLRASTDAGAYVLKMAGNITFGAAGRLEAGSSGTPYPVTCSFAIWLNGNYQITMSTGAVQLYCTNPTYQYIKLTAQASAGATVLSVDTDVTSDIWAAGDTVYICDVAGTLPDAESRIIAGGGIAAGTITITAGLTATKTNGSWVVLATRNVRIYGNAGVTSYGVNGGTGCVLRCIVSGCTYGVYGGSGHVISGAVSGCTTGVNSGSGHVISGAVSGCTTGVNSGSGHIISGAVSGCTYGVYGGSGHVISGAVSGCTTGVNSGSGHVISGAVSGCTTGVNSGSGHIISGAVSGCTTGIYGGSIILQQAVLESNTQDINQAEVRGYGAILNSVTQVANYTLVGPRAQTVIYDIGGIAEAIKAWMYGGRVIPVTDMLPDGYSLTHKFILEAATTGSPTSQETWCYVDIPFAGLKAQSIVCVVQMRKDTAALTGEPRLQIIDPQDDPLVDANAEPLEEAVMTDVINTWQTLTVNHTASYDRMLILRILARHGSGNMWAAWNAPGAAESSASITADALTITITEDAITAEVND